MPAGPFTIRFARPRAMKPAPSRPTRTGRSCAARSLKAVSTRIIFSSRGRLAGVRRQTWRRHPLFQPGLDLGERSPGAILVGNHGDRQRPLQAEARVVIAQPALEAWRVELADLVARVGLVAQHLIAVREPLGH